VGTVDTTWSRCRSVVRANIWSFGLRGPDLQVSMESEWVVLNCRMPNSYSADPRDGILLPSVVGRSGLRFACNGLHLVCNAP